MAERVGLGIIVRNLLWTILAPGMVTLYLPYRIVTDWYPVEIRSWNGGTLAGVPLIVIGVVILFSCIGKFAVLGEGTLSPLDAPKRLVTEGMYRYVRNPMYLAVMLILLGESLLFSSIPLAIYSAVCFVIFNLIIIFYEEPVLRRKFGKTYQNYCSRVGRWLPGK